MHKRIFLVALIGVLSPSIRLIGAFQFPSSSLASSFQESIHNNNQEPRIITCFSSSNSKLIQHQLPRCINSRRSSSLSLQRKSQENDSISSNNLVGGNNSKSSSSLNMNSSSSSDSDKNDLKIQVSPQRWVQLGYLSLLALLSDWICFSVAASPKTFEESFVGHSAANLIDIFLFTNVASCFLVTDVVKKFGLQKSIQGAAFVMTLGCWCRSGLGFLPQFFGPEVANAVGKGDYGLFGALDPLTPPSADDGGLVSYTLILVGTILVGAAQPFFQCTPPLLSATWFASNERATSTAVALNFNQIGIATAFLVGGAMATSTEGLESYFGLIAVICSIITLGTVLQFQGDPTHPPSASEYEKRISGEVEPPFLESVKSLFKIRGFTFPLVAFICSITITNIVGAFIDEVMCRGGITDQFQVDMAGAGFEIAILLGGIGIGGFVDRTKEYKRVTLICIAASAALIVPLGLTEHAIGQEPVLLLLALFSLGLFAGPIQPINAELAVDVAYPCDETAVESVQQIGGNLVSALLVPVAERAARADYQLFLPPLESDIRGDVVLLTALAGIAYTFYTFFDAPLRRTEAEKKINVNNESESLLATSPQMNMDSTLMMTSTAAMMDAEVISKTTTTKGTTTDATLTPTTIANTASTKNKKD